MGVKKKMVVGHKEGKGKGKGGKREYKGGMRTSFVGG